MGYMVSSSVSQVAMLRDPPGYDRLRNLVLLLLILSPIHSFSQIMLSPEEDVIGSELFEKRPERFSFGLGKRSGAKTKTISAEELEKLLAPFELLKTTAPPRVLKKLAMLLRVWKENRPLAIGSGGFVTNSRGTDTNRAHSGTWGYTSPHGLFKRLAEDDSSSMEDQQSNIEDKAKRAPSYSFGLGKR